MVRPENMQQGSQSTQRICSKMNIKVLPRLGQARGHAARISVNPKDMQQDEHQGPRTLMCSFEALRRGPWLKYGKAKMYVQISSKKNH